MSFPLQDTWQNQSFQVLRREDPSGKWLLRQAGLRHSETIQGDEEDRATLQSGKSESLPSLLGLFWCD